MEVVQRGAVEWVLGLAANVGLLVLSLVGAGTLPPRTTQGQRERVCTTSYPTVFGGGPSALC